ncbi:MAG: type III pantothenate kinase [Bacteroides sp.]|nr:type III pantothenate kinase [Bacteroides sp.]
MNLIVDIGNSIAKIGIFDIDNLLDVLYVPNKTLEGVNEISRKFRCTAGIVASVVALNEPMKKELELLPFTPLFFGKETPVPITNLYRTRDTLGYDRVAAVAGANYLFPGKNILVVDAGTALTFEFVDAEGQYQGGNISPGIQMRFKALNTFTFGLPLIDEKGESCLIGYSTETAIRSGVLNGIKYEVEGYIRNMKEKYPDFLVFLTGGDEISFESNLKNINFTDKFLVLKGLNRILNYNND